MTEFRPCPACRDYVLTMETAIEGLRLQIKEARAAIETHRALAVLTPPNACGWDCVHPSHRHNDAGIRR